MCTFQSDGAIMVCDVAIESVRSQLKAVGQAAEYTTVAGQGTLVRAASGVDTGRFGIIVQATIRVANQRD